MVAFVASWWVGALAAASTIVLQHFVKPRLPVYKIRIQNYPMLKWMQGKVTTKLHTSIEMHNDNYLPIDVHALWFDMYYMDWDGNLEHIGEVQDQRQKKLSEEKDAAIQSKVKVIQALKDKHNQLKNALSKSIRNDPMWKIAPRSNFSVTDELYVSTHPGSIAKTASRLVWSWWKGVGHLIVPTTGVAHIKTHKSPFTVSIVCDNAVNTWTMQVQGLECTLHQVVPGWTDLAKSADTLRDHALQNLQANATGGVLESASATASLSWADIYSHMSVDDVFMAT
jgi:hypothetical protein